jgi:hypothetical protein
MLQQAFYFALCEEYSALWQSNLYHLLPPPSKTHSTSKSSASGNFGKHKTRECYSGRGVLRPDYSLQDSGDNSQLIAGS